MLLARLGQTYGLDMLSLAGVETVLSPTDISNLKLDRAGTYNTYLNPQVFPRAWVADSIVSVPTHPDAIAALLKLGVMPDTVIVTGEDDLGGQALTGKPQVTLKDLSPNAVAVTVSGGGGGYLFLADTYAPGWRAYEEGLTPRRTLPIRPANVAFRVIALPEHNRVITFRYEPDSFRVGLFCSLLAFLLLTSAATFHKVALSNRHD
jgi:hypothetical protein